MAGNAVVVYYLAQQCTLTVDFNQPTHRLQLCGVEQGVYE